MKVTLISKTRDALELLLFTKQTRLAFDTLTLEEIRGWSEERKLKELAYMRGTIQSSWEFVDYTFLLQGVSRSFTHQLVRTRTASYAQQSQRTVDMSDFDYVTPRAIQDGEDRQAHFDAILHSINLGYKSLVNHEGLSPQDARAVLPEAIATNIVVKASLRTLHDMALVRLCTRTQGEYQDVFRAMRAEVIKVHPWAEEFIEVACVATGVCCFPNFRECPIQGPTFNPETGRRYDEQNWLPILTRKEIKQLWETTRFEAVPKEAKE